MADFTLLRRAAERVGERAFFLASVLLPHARAEGLDDAGLARYLGCEVAELPALLLCRRPAGETFQADVRRIADRFGLDAARLAEILRLAETWFG